MTGSNRHGQLGRLRDSKRHLGWSTTSQADAVPSACLSARYGAKGAAPRCRSGRCLASAAAHTVQLVLRRSGGRGRIPRRRNRAALQPACSMSELLCTVFGAATVRAIATTLARRGRPGCPPRAGRLTGRVLRDWRLRSICTVLRVPGWVSLPGSGRPWYEDEFIPPSRSLGEYQPDLQYGLSERGAEREALKAIELYSWPAKLGAAASPMGCSMPMAASRWPTAAAACSRGLRYAGRAWRSPPW